MSKKLYQSSKYKTLLKRRQVKRLQRMTRSQKKNAKRPVERKSLKLPSWAARRERRIEVPRIFSLIHDPENAVRFLASIDQKAQRNHLTLNFKRVESITPDAIAALISTLKMKSLRYRSRISGNEPDDPSARKMLQKSGFFDVVKHEHPVGPAATGMIVDRRGMRVDGKMAKELVRFGMACLTGEEKRCLPVYETLIECMTNTKHHAKGDDGPEESWWATVFADEKRRRVCFTFLDVGVGILRSAKVRSFRGMLRGLGIKDDADVMRWLLHGAAGSRTGQPERGKGLPKIHKWSTQGRIRSLVIVSNFVYANVEAEHYRLMSHSFEGTLLYWEVEP